MNAIGRRKLLLETVPSLGLIAVTTTTVAAAADPAAEATAMTMLLRQGGAPQNLATPTALFDRLITPTPSFFVRSHFGPPALDPARKLEVNGLLVGGKSLSLSVADLKKMPQTTITAVLQCAGNGRALHVPRVPGLQWVHGAMGQAAFTGVRVRDILNAAGGPTKEGQFIHMQGADAPPMPTMPAFIRSIPIARALDPSTLVAYRMNGEDLTLAHGAPMRLIVPGWAGDHWVKWLTRLSVAAEEAKGFYMETAYRMPIEKVEPGAAVPPEKMKPATWFPIKSLIGSPTDGAKAVPKGKQRIAGVAFAGEFPIAKVEVSIDDGKTWQLAKLEGEAGPGRWNVFRFEFDHKEPGRLRAMARATDKKGNVQPEQASWNPSGYFWNAWHSVSWEVV